MQGGGMAEMEWELKIYYPQMMSEDKLMEIF